MAAAWYLNFFITEQLSLPTQTPHGWNAANQATHKPEQPVLCGCPVVLAAVNRTRWSEQGALSRIKTYFQLFEASAKDEEFVTLPAFRACSYLILSFNLKLIFLALLKWIFVNCSSGCYWSGQHVLLEEDPHFHV